MLTVCSTDRIFFQALSQFQHIHIYANAVNDTTVPYVTAAIEAEDPFIEHRTNGIELYVDNFHTYKPHRLTNTSRVFDDNYKPLLKSYSLPEVAPPPPAKPLPLSPKWFSEIASRPFFPPRLQFRFPFNIVRNRQHLLPYISLIDPWRS